MNVCSVPKRVFQSQCGSFNAATVCLYRGKQVKIDWHSSSLTRTTVVDKNYKNTQNVRRFMLNECGPDFKFDRAFMAWIRNDDPKI